MLKLQPHEKLKILRMLYGYEQVEIANRFGTHKSYITLLECGRRQVTPKLKEQFCELYQMDKHTLFMTEDAEVFFNKVLQTYKVNNKEEKVNA